MAVLLKIQFNQILATSYWEKTFLYWKFCSPLCKHIESFSYLLYSMEISFACSINRRTLFRCLTKFLLQKLLVAQKNMFIDNPKRKNHLRCRFVLFCWNKTHKKQDEEMVRKNVTNIAQNKHSFLCDFI